VAEWVTAGDGRRLRAALFPQQGARATVVLSPGRTEPIEKYFEVVDELRARGFAVLVHDWRGQGLSGRLARDPRRGHAEGADAFLSDLSAVLGAYQGRLPRAWIAFGHSMGGGLMALALARGESRFAGAVLTAPMLGLNLGGRPARLVGRLAAGARRLGWGEALTPTRSDPLDMPFAFNLLTHDEARWARFTRQIAACPELRLGGATWGWLDFALTLSVELARPGAAERVKTPILAFTAGHERLVDNAAIRSFIERAPNGELIELADSRHEILMETDAVRARFFQAFDQWVEGVLGEKVPPAAI
jgi:lysophospholipase